MSKRGLLSGIGNGLVHFGGALNQGMNADISAKRQDEAEARRQASIEKRWAKQDADQRRRENKSDERFEQTQKRQTERDNKRDEQFDKNLSVREGQVIERNLSGIMDAKQRAERDIISKYQKQEVDSMGQPLQGDALAQLQAAMKSELSQVRQQFSNMLDDRVRSYGDKLKGTGFAYLLDIPDTSTKTTVEAAEESSLGPLTNNPADDREAMYQKVLADQAQSNNSQVTPQVKSEAAYFGNSSEEGISGYQAIGRGIGNMLPLYELTEQQKTNSYGGLMPKKSLLQY